MLLYSILYKVLGGSTGTYTKPKLNGKNNNEKFKQSFDRFGVRQSKCPIFPRGELEDRDHDGNKKGCSHTPESK